MSKVTIQGLKGTRQVAHAVYDFSKDGGSFGGGNEIDLFKLSAGMIVHDFWLEVEEAVVGTLSTLEVGITGGDTDSIVKQIAEADLVADYVSNDNDKGVSLFDATDKSNERIKYSAETILSLLIGTADLTAGKVHFYVEYSAGY